MRFLRSICPRYNERFTVCPAHEADVHVKLPRSVDLDEYLCIKTERTIRNDNTIALDGRLYQIEEPAGKKVVVEERIDGSLLVISKDVALKYKEITERPQKEVVPKPNIKEYNRPPKPSKRSSLEKEMANPASSTPTRDLYPLTK